MRSIPYQRERGLRIFDAACIVALIWIIWFMATFRVPTLEQMDRAMQRIESSTNRGQLNEEAGQ